MIDVTMKEFDLLVTLRKVYRKSCHSCRYANLMNGLKGFDLQKVEEIKVYAESNLDYSNKISMALAILGFMIPLVNQTLYTLIIIIVAIGYLGFALYIVKVHRYIIFVCEEKIEQMKKDI